MMKTRITDLLKSIPLIILGTAIAAFGLVVLLKPAHMAPGGIGAISVILSDITPLTVGVLMLCMNVPLFLAGLKMNRAFFLKSVAGALFYSLFADLMAFVPVPVLDNFLCSVFGGVAMGIGFGFVFLSGGSTGGTDILAWILHRKAPHIKLGNAVLIFDLTIITIQSVIYKSVEAGMYAAVALYISTKIIDLVTEGAAVACKTVYVISGSYEEISKQIMEKLERGVTALSANGMYTGNEKKVLMCTVGAKELPRLKKIISAVDREAFAIVTDTREVFGEGFDSII